MGFIYFASFRCVIVAWDVDKLQNEGSPSDNAAASGQKVPSYDILQHRRFAGGLGANDDLGKLLAGENICGGSCRKVEESHDLWEVEGVIADSVEDQILELVDYPKQVLAERCHLC